MRLLDFARDRIAGTAMALARRAATDVGWRRMCHAMGAPNMFAGLVRLRDLGVAPRAIIDGGACMGNWTTLCKSVYPDASILMIEPQGLHRATLEARLRTIRPHRAIRGNAPRSARRTRSTLRRHG